MADRCEKCGQVTGYQGYKNWATWNFALVMSNTQGDYNYCRGLVAEGRRRALAWLAEDPQRSEWSNLDKATRAEAGVVFADEFGTSSAWADEKDPEDSLVAAIWRSALESVDFFEVAERFFPESPDEWEELLREFPADDGDDA